MHIRDGYLSPQTYVPLYGATFVFWSVALKKVKKELSNRQIPYLAMAAAFSFLIMMFNIPIPGSTTGHAVGAGNVAIQPGPWTAGRMAFVFTRTQTRCEEVFGAMLGRGFSGDIVLYRHDGMAKINLFYGALFLFIGLFLLLL